MADDQIVDEELISTEEPVSTEVVPEVKPQEQSLTKEDVTRMIAEQTEVAKREIQSAKDKAKAEVDSAQRRARFAEDSLGRVRGRYENLDPEARQALEVEDLRAENLAFKQRDQQGIIERQRAEEEQSLVQALMEHLSDMGIDPNDKRIDWAIGATTRSEGLRKFNKSMAQITKEDVSTNAQKVIQDAKDKLAQERKEAGLDSTDEGTLSGVSGKKTFTQAQISDRKFWEANKEDILKAQEDGRIID